MSDSDKDQWTRQDLETCMWENSGSINHRHASLKSNSLWTRYASKVKNLANSILLRRMDLGK
jgi:hypothetical protein